MHIVILGNGIAGITTARYIRKLGNYDITVISAETDHFFSRTALMYIYMGHMKYEHTKPYEDWFWEKNKIKLLRKKVVKLDPAAKALTLNDGASLNYDKLVLATGSEPNKFGWPGQDLEGVQGLYSFQDLQSMETHSAGLQRAVIVGGGLIGIEMAEMFHSRHIPVTFLVREDSFWDHVIPPEESAMVNREILRNGIDLQLKTELKEILPDANGKARAVITSKGEEIECQFVGLTAGVHARIELAAGTDIETGRGFLVDEFLETSVPDVYAVGDCAELRKPAAGRRGIEAVWYTGKHMGPVLAQTIYGNKTEYKQKIWFNSAKFFDIEYQVYGSVPAKPQENETHLYWEHEDGRKSIRIVYNNFSQKILGFNLMGIRYRHDVCHRWLEQEASIQEVLENLSLANFDPEFFDQYEEQVIGQYNQQNPGTAISLKAKKGLAGVFEFLKK